VRADVGVGHLHLVAERVSRQRHDLHLHLLVARVVLVFQFLVGHRHPVGERRAQAVDDQTAPHTLFEGRLGQRRPLAAQQLFVSRLADEPAVLLQPRDREDLLRQLVVSDGDALALGLDHRHFLVDHLRQDLLVDAELPEQLLVHRTAELRTVGLYLGHVTLLEVARPERPSVDLRVQQAAEEALRGQRAAAVAIDPTNGDVLAFVSTPAFDPNLFARGLSRPQYLALTEDPDRPMYDRALRGVYPPGSTIKPFFALAALESGVVTAHDTRFCRGMWSAAGYGRARRDWKPGGHGTVDMRRALATSCDIYFFDMARLMGIDRMAGFLSKFGLGATTGIDIEGERLGIVPSTEWKKRAYKKPEFQVWFPGDTISVGIGQGQMLVTPLQLANAVAGLANKGHRFKPRLVRAVRDVQTGKVHEIPPEPLPNVKLADEGEWDIAQGGMFDVVNAPHGTARYYLQPAPAYQMAGKSGTAQVFSVAINERVRKAGELEEHLRDHALFVSFAPFDAPKIAVAVVVENAPGGGSAFASPIARRILDRYLLTPEQWAEQEAKRKPTGPVATPTNVE